MKVFEKIRESQLLGYRKFGQEDNPSCYYIEHLFKTKDGFYFVYARGGALTKYGVKDENGNWQPSEDIILPLSKDGAIAWAIKNLERPICVKEFGDDIYD